MGLWKIWLVGLAMTIITSIIIYGKAKINKFFIDILVATDIAIVGGIVEGFTFYLCFVLGRGFIPFLISVLISLLIAVSTWGALTGMFLKENLFRPIDIVLFILVFIIASVCWAQLITNYYNNIEEIDETVVINEQENQLLYFCNIPVQQLSENTLGDVSGSTFWEDVKISGSISTLEEVQYWYLNGNGEGKYESAPTNSSKIRFIEENEQTYVKVITYRNQIRTVNHNNGEETTEIQSEWQEYIFYLPQAIMQYPLE